MSHLGDQFPDDQRLDYILRNLIPGKVLYLFCRFSSAPKEKYLVFLCPEEPGLFFAINSKINDFIQKNPYLLEQQVRLSKSSHPFLDHDSFINCSEVLAPFSAKELLDQLLPEFDRIKGELDQATRKEIVRVVANSRTVSPRHKRLIQQAFK